MKNDLNEDQLNQGVTVSLPLRAVLRLAELKAGDTVMIDARGGTDAARLQKALASTHLPAIGAVGVLGFSDEVFAGLTLDNDRPYYLMLRSGELTDCSWQKAMDWARPLGSELPSRLDLLVLWQNRAKLPKFEAACYWSSEVYADDAAYAWYQCFDHGSQGWGHKDNELRARAVRRVPI